MYATTDTRFLIPKDKVVPGFICNREWKIEDFITAMELNKITKQKDTFYSERKAFQRWVSKETNFNGVWKKVMEEGNSGMAVSLAKSLEGEFKLFCEDNHCDKYLRQAENFYRRCLALIDNHFLVQGE